MSDLSDEDRAVLDLAAEDIRGRGAMAREIHARFRWTPTRYYQRLDGLISTRAAIEYDPMTCARLRRLVSG